MSFVSLYKSPTCLVRPCLWFIFNDDGMLVRKTADSACPPRVDTAEQFGVDPSKTQFLGMLDEEPCFAAEVDSVLRNGDDGLCFEPLRDLFGLLSDDLFKAAATASMILHWDRNSRFCGSCGSPTRLSTEERAKICNSCGMTVFPRISPAVIVSVVQCNRILLVHCKRHPEGLYSVIAGFVEPGETLEECAAREVKEETGIDISDIRYFASQPWPFPDTLMVAFTACYAGGDIEVDGREVTHAAWFSADELPRIPQKISIARRLIDRFAQEHRDDR